MPRLKRKLTALGVHVFAGGFTCGVKRSGFGVLGHLEDAGYGVSTARLNWPDLDVRVGEENWRAGEFTGRVDFLYSNPPCAIFSTTGIAVTRGPGAWREDPRLGCWHRAFGVFEVVRPKIFALESVCQAYTKGREVIDEFTGRAVDLGYSVRHVLTDAKWAGVPQSRRRFFFVAHLPGVPLRLAFNFDEPPTVGEVLAGVGDPGFVDEHDTGANFKQWIRHTRPGGKLRETFDRLKKSPEKNTRGHVVGRPGFNWLRLSAHRQMGALVEIPAHPIKNRFLGIEEVKALCGYPESFKLTGRPKQWVSLLARAVLPPVGEWLAGACKTAVRGEVRQGRRVVTLVDLRKPGVEPTDLTGEYL